MIESHTYILHFFCCALLLERLIPHAKIKVGARKCSPHLYSCIDTDMTYAPEAGNFSETVEASDLRANVRHMQDSRRYTTQESDVTSLMVVQSS